MRLFFMSFFLIYGLINFWIIRFFWKALYDKRKIRNVACVTLLLLAVSFLAFYRSSGISALELFLLRAGSFWLGTFFYIFALILIIQLVPPLKKILLNNPDETKNARFRYITCGTLLFIALDLGVYGWINATHPIVNEKTLMIQMSAENFEKLPKKSLTIAAISDIHLGRLLSTKHLDYAIKLLRPYRLDTLFVLGDFIDDHHLLDMGAIQKAMNQITPLYGIWGILGNHEYISGDINISRAILEQSGINVLRDEWRILGGMFLVIGRDDYSISRFTDLNRKTLPQILERLPEEYNYLPKIILDHQPFHRGHAEDVDAILQMSGHTHNGQLWPFNLVVKKVYENPRGLSKSGNTYYFTSVGTGTWGPRLRNNAPPEVVVLHLQFIPK